VAVIRERLTFGHGTQRPVPPAAAITRTEESQPVKLLRLDTWDWGWGGLLIFTLLLFFRPQDQVPGLKNAHLSDIAAIVGLIGMAAVNVSRRQPIMRFTPEIIGLLLFGLVILLTVPTSHWPGGSFELFRVHYLSIALIFCLMVNTVTSPKRIERMVWVIVLAFGYMSANAVFDYARGVNLVSGRVAGTVGGFFQNPNDLALNLAAFLPFALMYVKRSGLFSKRALCAGISLLMLLAIVFTKSRGGFIGTVVMLATFLWVARLITPATIIALVLTGMVALPAMPSSFWQRMASITDERKDDQGSRRERRLLLEQGVEVFLENPLTGVGAGQFQNYWRPGLPTKWHEVHNVFLQVATELGVFGLLTFSFLVWRGFSAARWTRKYAGGRRSHKGRDGRAHEEEDGLNEIERVFLQTHGAAMVAAMVGWFVCALFASVAFNWTFYYLLGLSVAARDVVRARAAAYADARRRGATRAVAA
jgi:putative inorganic carbon (HCO3(-)) transporter